MVERLAWGQVRGEHGPALIGEHPGQMVDQSSLADATLVVEEGNGYHVTALTVTARNSGAN